MAMLAEKRQKPQWILNPRGKKWTSDLGQKLLEKMGWKNGDGLGANLQGPAQHCINVSVRNDNRGVGFKGRPEDVLPHQDNYSALLAQLGTVDQPDNHVSTEKSLEAKSRKSKARVHYHKFIRSKDLSKYSEKDLACIVGKQPQSKSKQEDPEDDFVQTGKNMKHYFSKIIESKQIVVPEKFKSEDEEHSLFGFGFNSNNINDLPNVSSDYMEMVSSEELFAAANDCFKEDVKTSNQGDSLKSNKSASNMFLGYEEVHHKRKKSRKKNIEGESTVSNNDSLSDTHVDNSFPGIENSLSNSGHKKKTKIKVLNSEEICELPTTCEDSLETNTAKKKKSKKKKKDKLTVSETQECEESQAIDKYVHLNMEDLVSSEHSVQEETQYSSDQSNKRKKKAKVQEPYQMEEPEVPVNDGLHKKKRKKNRNRIHVEDDGTCDTKTEEESSLQALEIVDKKLKRKRRNMIDMDEGLTVNGSCNNNCSFECSVQDQKVKTKKVVNPPMLLDDNLRGLVDVVGANYSEGLLTSEKSSNVLSDLDSYSRKSKKKLKTKLTLEEFGGENIVLEKQILTSDRRIRNEEIPAQNIEEQQPNLAIDCDDRHMKKKKKKSKNRECKNDSMIETDDTLIGTDGTLSDVHLKVDSSEATEENRKQATNTHIENYDINVSGNVESKRKEIKNKKRKRISEVDNIVTDPLPNEKCKKYVQFSDNLCTVQLIPPRDALLRKIIFDDDDSVSSADDADQADAGVINNAPCHLEKSHQPSETAQPVGILSKHQDTVSVDCAAKVKPIQNSKYTVINNGVKYINGISEHARRLPRRLNYSRDASKLIPYFQRKDAFDDFPGSNVLSLGYKGCAINN